MSKLAIRIRNAILADVTDRRGWGQEWNMFGSDIQRQIRHEHARIIDRILENNPSAIEVTAVAMVNEWLTSDHFLSTNSTSLREKLVALRDAVAAASDRALGRGKR